MAYPESLCLQGTRPPTYPWESLDHGLFSRYFWRNNPTIMPNTEEGKVKWILLCRGPDTPMEPGKVCQDIGLTAS